MVSRHVVAFKDNKFKNHYRFQRKCAKNIVYDK